MSFAARPAGLGPAALVGPAGLMVFALAALAACAGGEGTAGRPGAGPSERRPGTRAGARGPAGPPVVVFRVPRAGGPVRAYRWDRLDSATWTSAVPLAPIARIVGFAAGPGYLVLSTPKGGVLWLDVRRNELLPPGPALTLTAPAADGFASRGEVVGVDSANLVVRATPAGAAWRVRPPAPVRALVPLPDGALVGYGHTATDGELWRWNPLDTVLAQRTTVARNAVVASGATGGRLWLAAPGGLWAIAPATLAEALALGDLPRGTARDVATTPSGSTAFALHDGTAAIAVVDRYRGVRIPNWTLPGQPRSLRVDAEGRTLLVRPATGESAWAVDIATSAIRSTLSTSWRADLPAVSPDGAVLTVLGPDVTVLDPETLQRRRTVADGASDWWLVTVWDGFTARPGATSRTTWAGIDTAPTASPDSASEDGSPTTRDDSASETTVRAVDDSAPAPADGAPAARWLVSVASLVSEEAATQMAREIRATGAPARVLRAQGERGAVFRVVMGPFASRDSAVRAGRTSGRPHWIVPAR